MPGLWFNSRTVRQARALRKNVQRLLDQQRDILSSQSVQAVQGAIQRLQDELGGKSDKPALEKEMAALEKTANQSLKPYPHAAWRENVEVLLVALAVALGIRTFFLQPFKIPTGSMQPTLFGVTSQRLGSDFRKPTGWNRLREWFGGVSYVRVVAESDGTLEAVEPPWGLPIFKVWQKLVFAGKTYMIWFPPDYGAAPFGTLEVRAGLRPGQSFRRGEDIVHLRVQSGDHLFVDRVTYNFRPPWRGEIIVFETKGIPDELRLRYGIPGDQFYIKRLVGFGAETLSLQPDHLITGVPVLGAVSVGHLVVNGQPLSPTTPHFDKLYSYSGASVSNRDLPFLENHYYGHALLGNLAAGLEFRVDPNHFYVMGDNTLDSLDSRYWCDFPQSYAVGKPFFVYWPITKRSGWGYRH